MFDCPPAPPIDPEVLLGSAPLPPIAGPIRLDLSCRASRERHAVLRECFARMGYSYIMTPLQDAPFEADLSFNMLPGVMVAEGFLHGSRNRRTKEIIDDTEDEAVLMVNLQGPQLIEQFGRELVLGDGEAVLISGTDPSCFTHKPPGKVMGLRVPKSQLIRMLKDGEQSYMRPIPAGSAALSLLRNYVGLTWNAEVARNPAVQRLMSDHILDLIAVTAGAARDAAAAANGNALHAARLEAVKQDIGRQLEHPNLSVEIFADRHGLTPRTLQRMFESDGTTFTKYVLEQRLNRAHRMLAAAGRTNEKISTVAYECGFADLSYFNRMFRRHYGAAPSDIRSQLR